MTRSFIFAAGLILAGMAAMDGFKYASLDRTVLTAIQKDGSKMTQTQVRVNKGSLSPSTGEGALRGFSVANPKGFKNASAVSADKVRMRLSLDSLRTPVIVVDSVLVDEPVIDLEKDGAQGSNFAQLLQNLEGAPPLPKEAQGPMRPQKKLIIGALRVTDARLTGDRTGTLPPIELQALGQDEGGLPPNEVVARIARALAKAAGEQLPLSPTEQRSLETRQKGAERPKGLPRRATPAPIIHVR